MVSRATSLSGLLILRPFDANKVRAHASQDFRCDACRLLIHSLKTILSSPTEYSRHDEATAQLTRSMHTMHSPQTRSMTPIPRGVDADMQPNGSSRSLPPYQCVPSVNPFRGIAVSDDEDEHEDEILDSRP